MTAARSRGRLRSTHYGRSIRRTEHRRTVVQRHRLIHARLFECKWTFSDEVKRLTAGKGVDIVIKTAGGHMLNQALDAMAPFGRMIFLGQFSGETALVDPWRLTSMNHSVIGFYVDAYLADAELLMATVSELVGLVSEGTVKIQVGTVLPLSQAAEAHRLLEGRRTTGKVVLQPWAD